MYWQAARSYWVLFKNRTVVYSLVLLALTSCTRQNVAHENCGSNIEVESFTPVLHDRLVHGLLWSSPPISTVTNDVSGFGDERDTSRGVRHVPAYPDFVFYHRSASSWDERLVDSISVEVLARVVKRRIAPGSGVHSVVSNLVLARLVTPDSTRWAYAVVSKITSKGPRQEKWFLYNLKDESIEWLDGDPVVESLQTFVSRQRAFESRLVPYERVGIDFRPDSTWAYVVFDTIDICGERMRERIGGVPEAFRGYPVK